MLFRTMQEWEEKSELVRSVNSPYQLYSAIELFPFSIFFILELKVKINNDVFIGRIFFIEDCENVLGIISDKSVKMHRLSVFVPGKFNDTKEISVHTVRKIFRAKNKDNSDILIYDCFDGKRFLNKESDKGQKFKNPKCIYNSEIANFDI